MLPLLLLHAALAEDTTTLGPVITEVSDRSAIVWARAPGDLELSLKPGVKAAKHLTIIPSPDHDHTGTVRLSGLKPATTYTVRLRPSGGSGAPLIATFRTAPAPEVAAPVHFVLSGDLGGQGRCRRLGPDGAELGYPIFQAIAAVHPDFFIMNGDQIYADNLCAADGPKDNELGVVWKNLPGPPMSVADPSLDWRDAQTMRRIFWSYWEYNRSERNYQSLLRQTALYPQWDDHEVINDDGASWPQWHEREPRPGFPTLAAEGKAAFEDYNPVEQAGGDGGLYRAFRWGKDVELFLVDARSFRSENALPDTALVGKTMLGKAQRSWLVQRILASDATFKVISVDVPLAQPTGSSAELYGHDAWANGEGDDDYSRRLRAFDQQQTRVPPVPAPVTDSWFPQREPPKRAEDTGFERELRAFLLELDRAHVRNLVFLATDVHFAQIARYSIDLDGDGDPLVLYEVIAGPLSAGSGDPSTPDPSLNPTVLYAEGKLFNFAELSVDRPGGTPTLTVQIRGVDGAPRPGGSLSLPAR